MIGFGFRKFLAVVTTLGIYGVVGGGGMRALAAESAGSIVIMDPSADDPGLDLEQRWIPVVGTDAVIWMRQGLDMKLRWIPAGSIQPESSDGGQNGSSVQSVTVDRGFWIGVTEVTQAQWDAVMDSNPSAFKGPDLPVEQVSWIRVMEFCRRLTEREQAAGRLPAGYTYTLPTEAQWEYASRAGTTTDFAGSVDAMAWYAKNSGGTTHPVGQIQGNAWLLHDMHGNVWEWTRDQYVSLQNFNAFQVGSRVYRIVRGGSWGSEAAELRSGNRAYNTENYSSSRMGFRVVLSAN